MKKKKLKKKLKRSFKPVGPWEIVKAEAGECIRVIFKLIGLRKDNHKFYLADLFQTDTVNIYQFIVKRHINVSGYYWLAPRLRQYKRMRIKPGVLLYARTNPDKMTIDINWDGTGHKEHVMTLSDQDFLEISARLYRLPLPKIRGGLGDCVKEIGEFYGKTKQQQEI